jgi:hypothetical protein
VRYGLLGDASGLHDIWGLSSNGAMTGLSLGVLVLFAAVLTVVGMRVFARSAVR